MSSPTNITRIYASGPMTSYPELNCPAFAVETARFRALRYEVFSPAEINPAGGTWHERMQREIPQMVTCNLLAKLPGWIGLPGACIEILLAQQLEIKVAMASSITEQCAEAA